MRAINGGIIVESMETHGKHGDGNRVVEVYYFHVDGRVEMDWAYE